MILQRDNNFNHNKNNKNNNMNKYINENNNKSKSKNNKIIIIAGFIVYDHDFGDMFVTWEDDGKHLTSCVGQMPKNVPKGQTIVKISSYRVDLYNNNNNNNNNNIPLFLLSHYLYLVGV